MAIDWISGGRLGAGLGRLIGEIKGVISGGGRLAIDSISGGRLGAGVGRPIGVIGGVISGGGTLGRMLSPVGGVGGVN